MRQFASLAIFSVIFGFISHLVEELEEFGMPAIEYLHTQHTPFLDFFFKYVTKGGFEIFFVLIPIGCYWGNYGRKIVEHKTTKKKEDIWPFCLDFMVILLHTWFLLSLFKLVFTRPRPFQVNNLISVIEEVKIVEFSYPSGHASGSSVCWMFLYMSYYDYTKKHNFFVILFGIIAVSLVGISRVYFGVHYPHDIIAGYAMGISISILFRKYHKGKTRLYICLGEILFGAFLGSTLSLEMLDHHPGICFCPAALSLILFFSYVWKSDLLPHSSPLRLLKEETPQEDLDLPVSTRIARLILGVVLMFTIPFPVLFIYVIGSHYLWAIPYAFLVFSFLLVIIPYTFTLLNLHRVKPKTK